MKKSHAKATSQCNKIGSFLANSQGRIDVALSYGSFYYARSQQGTLDERNSIVIDGTCMPKMKRPMTKRAVDEIMMSFKFKFGYRLLELLMLLLLSVAIFAALD